MRNTTILRTIILTGAALLSLAFAPAVWAENKAPDTVGRVQAEGVVMGMVKLTPDQGGKPVLRVSIQKDSGDILTIQACDRISSNEQGPGFALGDRIRAVGALTQMDGLAVLQSCDIRILSAPADTNAPAAPQVTYVPTYPSTDVLVVGDVNPYGYYYPPFYGACSPFVFFWSPFFHSQFFFDRDGFRDRGDRVGFHGSSGVRFNHTGTWHSSGGTWTRPGTTGVMPRTVAPRTTAPRTTAPRTFSSTVPHHTWSPSPGAHITSTRPIAPRMGSAPCAHGSFSGSSMHGAGHGGGFRR